MKAGNIKGRIIKDNHNGLEYISSIFLGKKKGEFQHLYIISDDPIEVGDLYLIEDDEDDDTIYQCIDNGVWSGGKRSKIIMTTHPGLRIEMIDPKKVERYLDFLSI